jgi:hypothetical protein
MAGRTQHLYWGPSNLVFVSVMPRSRWKCRCWQCSKADLSVGAGSFRFSMPCLEHDVQLSLLPLRGFFGRLLNQKMECGPTTPLAGPHLAVHGGREACP